MRKETNKETVYDGTKEEVKVVACLIHPNLMAQMKYQAKELNGFAVVDYGLCGWCVSKVKHDPTYNRHIDKQLSERLDNLKPEGGE